MNSRWHHMQNIWQEQQQLMQPRSQVQYLYHNFSLRRSFHVCHDPTCQWAGLCRVMNKISFNVDVLMTGRLKKQQGSVFNSNKPNCPNFAAVKDKTGRVLAAYCFSDLKSFRLYGMMMVAGRRCAASVLLQRRTEPEPLCRLDASSSSAQTLWLPSYS